MISKIALFYYILCLIIPLSLTQSTSDSVFSCSDSNFIQECKNICQDEPILKCECHERLVIHCKEQVLNPAVIYIILSVGLGFFIICSCIFLMVMVHRQRSDSKSLEKANSKQMTLSPSSRHSATYRTKKHTVGNKSIPPRDSGNKPQIYSSMKW